MNIFIDTPQRAAERLENRRRQQKTGWYEDARYGEVKSGTAESAGSEASSMPDISTVPDLDLDEVPGYESPGYGPLDRWPEARGRGSEGRGLRSRGPFGRRALGRAAIAAQERPHARRAFMDDEPQSVAADAYRDEKAYDRKRARRHKRGHALRILLLALLMPIVIAAVFLVSYVLTCILNGATPEEVVESLGNLALRVESFLVQVNLL